MTRYLRPNGALFIGGPWDGRIEDFGGNYPPIVEVPILKLNHGVDIVEYRRERYGATEQDGVTRDWILYVYHNMTLTDAVAMLFMGYAMRRERPVWESVLDPRTKCK